MEIKRIYTIVFSCMILFMGCARAVSEQFSVTFDAGDFVLNQEGHEEQRVQASNGNEMEEEMDNAYIKLDERVGGLHLEKIMIRDDPDSLDWTALSQQTINCQAQGEFDFEGRVTEDSIFFYLEGTDSAYGFPYGAGESVYFYYRAGTVYTFMPPLPGGRRKQDSVVDAPQKTETETAVTDSVLYIVNCDFLNVVLDGGSSIIYVIDNIIEPGYLSEMGEYCAIGLPDGVERSQDSLRAIKAKMLVGAGCNPTGRSEFEDAAPIMIAAANWCDRLNVVHHCLEIPMPDETVQKINLITCQAQLTFVDDSIAIRSGCPVSSGNCCGNDQ
jgi:hypothetical protein